MKKAPDAFRTISEVSDWLDTPAHVLRFWESRFTQVKPVKRAGGRRYYRPDDMRLLGGIKQLLHNDGLTIKGVQKILREKGIKHVADLSQAVTDAEIDPARDSRPEARTASDMDSLTAKIADKVASTARAREAPASTPEPPEQQPLILGKVQTPAAAAQDAGQPESHPAGAIDGTAETPQFRRRAPDSAPPDPAEATRQPAENAEVTAGGDRGDQQQISDLYGRLKSLRQRMQDA